jgi:hypothetical protein
VLKGFTLLIPKPFAAQAACFIGELAAPALGTSTLGSTRPAHHCQNCGYEGAGQFCQEYGQSFSTHRITLLYLLHEVFHLFTHVEKGFLYTLRELLLRPGHMQRR